MAVEMGENYDVVDTTTKQLSNEQLQEKNNEEKDLQLDVHNSLGNVEYKTMRNAEVSLAEMEAFANALNTAINKQIMEKPDINATTLSSASATMKEMPACCGVSGRNIGLYANKDLNKAQGTEYDDKVLGKGFVGEIYAATTGHALGIGGGLEASFGHTPKRTESQSTAAIKMHPDMYHNKLDVSAKAKAGLVFHAGTHGLFSLMATLGWKQVRGKGQTDCVTFTRGNKGLGTPTVGGEVAFHARDVLPRAWNFNDLKISIYMDAIKTPDLLDNKAGGYGINDIKFDRQIGVKLTMGISNDND